MDYQFRPVAGTVTKLIVLWSEWGDNDTCKVWCQYVKE